MRTISLAFWLLSWVTHAQYNTAFEKANELYNSGDFDSAVSQYEGILKANLHSAELYYNLANSYYKLNKVAPSIYYYEKALLLSPHDKDILNNLSFAQKMTVDKISDVPKLGLIELINSSINLFKTDQWAIICIIFMILFVLLFIAYYLTNRTRTKRLFFIMEGAVLAFLILSFVLTIKKLERDNTLKYGIIFSQEIELKSEPSLKSETLYLLHEGTKVQLINTFANSWTKILLSDGKTGWLPNSTFKGL